MTSSAPRSRAGATTPGAGADQKVDESGQTRPSVELRAELERTRAALAAAEQELSELRASRSRAMAELERKAYWLERAQIDPDAWMRRPALAFAFKAFQRLRRLSWRLFGGAR